MIGWYSYELEGTVSAGVSRGYNDGASERSAYKFSSPSFPQVKPAVMTALFLFRPGVTFPALVDYSKARRHAYACVKAKKPGR